MDVELEFDKKFRVSLSPKTVLPLYPKRSSKQRKDQSLAVEGGRDIRYECYRSASCRSIPSRLSVLEGPMELKRGSVYQDSIEVGKLKRMSDGVSRRKIEISRSCETTNALDPDSKRERSRDLPVHPALIRISASKADADACSSDGFIDINLESDDRRKPCRKGFDRDLSYSVVDVNSPANDGNILLEEDEIHAEVPEMLETPQKYSNCQSIDRPKSHACTKSRFSPIKKMMDPFLKSKSLKSSLSFESAGQNDGKTGCRKSSKETLLNPLPCNFLEMKEHVSHAQESPTLLHACLTLKTKYGTPLFEFTMKNPEVSFLARIWKRNLNAGDWVYTFHSVKAKKHRDVKELPMVGQMQVSSRLCRESNRIVDKSIVTEFVLYDLANTTTVKSVHESSDGAWDISPFPKVTEGMWNDTDITKGYNLKQGMDAYPAAIAYPWEPATLHPNLETAEIIVQIPLDKGESLKFNKGVVMARDKSLPDVNGVRNSAPFDSVDVFDIVVVTPAGSHSLPDAENQGPSPLLDRWRLGGGCECGGWDMGCPLNVFSNPVIQKKDDDGVEIARQGENEKTSALSIKVIEEGKYDVAFHACLSALQAFSISVAILHGSETSLTQKGKHSERTTQCSPLKLLIEHELERLIEAFAEEDKKQFRTSNKENQLSFAVNPQFSPMSRV